MAKVSIQRLLFTFLALSSLPHPIAFAAHMDESPLDSLIPKEIQNRIDQRKSRLIELNSEAKISELNGFNGSREVDLRHRDTPVKQQFSAKKCVGLFRSKVGTCSAFGLTAALENALGGGVDLSERQLWSQYCTPSSSAAINALTKGKGMVEESWWPQNKLSPASNYSKAPRFKAVEFHSLEDNIPGMLEALDRGSPLYLALNTPSEMYARKEVIQANSGHTSGGHAVAIVGYKLDESVEGGGYFLVKNSWGTSNGRNGYQWLSMGYCARRGNYCLAWSIDRAANN